MKLKKTLSGVLAVTTLLLGSLSTLGSANAYSIETNDTPKASTSSVPESSGTAMEKDYGLAPSIQQGAILHAFCWDFDTIKNNMELIAQSGYTAVQTSPVSFCYDDYPDKTLLAEDSKKYDGTAGAWWWHYQPTALTVGNYQLGDDTKYAQMCAEADKYGVKIITDIVANHTTSHYKKNSSGEEVTGLGIDADAYFDAVCPSNHSDLYHPYGLPDNDISSSTAPRYKIINWKRGGLPDINTENPAYQKYLLDYLNELIKLGCDGFRFDTARNIGVKSKDGTYSDPTNDVGSYTNYNFWNVVTGDDSQDGNVVIGSNTYHLSDVPDDFFFYGEILGNDIGNGQDNQSVFNAYSDYIKVTDSAYGDTLRSSVSSKNFSKDTLSGWGSHPLSSDKLVTWVESHDSYCNVDPTFHESGWLSDWQIRACWAVIAARSGGTPLFYNRPEGSNGSEGNYWGTNQIGIRGNDQFFDPEVVAVNKFRNAMANAGATGETFRNITSGSYTNRVLQIDRYNSDANTSSTCGSCIINISSSNVSLSGKETDMENGTYIDIVSGKTVKVSDSHFETGNVAANSIAVIYQASTLDAEYTSESFTDTIDVTPTIINGGSVTTGTYTVNVDGTKINSGSFTSGQAITIGSNITVDSGFKDIDFVISADINGKTIGKTFSFVKRAQSDITYAYIDTTGRGWGNNLYAYVYGKTAEGESVKNSNWPGKPMTIDSGAVYKYEVPHDLKNGYVIFNDGTNQYPASGGFCLNGNSMILTKLNEWTAYKNTAIIDDDFNTYNYIYFFNSFGWWGTVTANFTDGANSDTIQMEMSNDLHCYYCKYPVNRNYTSVSFKVGAHTTSNALLKDNSGTNNAGKIYVPQADGGQWILASSLVEHTVYFEVTTSKWTNANAYMWRSAGDNLTFQNTAFPGESMTQCYQKSNTHVYKYTYYYPQTTDNINDYEKVIFYSPAASAQTTNLSISTSTEGKLYKYTRTGTVDSDGHFLADISEVTSSKNLEVTIEYTNHKISESDDVEDYSVESNKFFKTTVDVTNGNISYAIADACDKLGMTNVYDKYTLYGSQFGYVSKMASLADDRLKHNVPYSAYINPNVLSRRNDAFSAIYSNSSTYISELKDCANNPKWITLYDTSGKEIDYSLINPDLSNLGSIKLYAFSKPKLYNVKFYYPTIKSPSTNISFNNNSLVTENSVFESYESRYNLLLSNATRDIEENMKVPTGKVFDGWYKIEWKGQSSAVASFLKISSEDEYKYRITDDCVFYAAFRDEKAELPENKATVISNPVDVFYEGNNKVKYYRYNTLLNICDLSDNDSKIREVGIVYVKLNSGQSYDIDTVKTSITTNILGKSTIPETIKVNNNDNANSSAYMYSHYTVGDGSENTVRLTSKNRMQFNLKMTETQATSGNYSNVLAFTAYNYNGTWEVSENCIQYQNGKANTVMLANTITTN